MCSTLCPCISIHIRLHAYPSSAPLVKKIRHVHCRFAVYFRLTDSLTVAETDAVYASCQQRSELFVNACRFWGKGNILQNRVSIIQKTRLDCVVSTYYNTAMIFWLFITFQFSHARMKYKGPSLDISFTLKMRQETGGSGFNECISFINIEMQMVLMTDF